MLKSLPCHIHDSPHSSIMNGTINKYEVARTRTNNPHWQPLHILCSRLHAWSFLNTGSCFLFPVLYWHSTKIIAHDVLHHTLSYYQTVPRLYNDQIPTMTRHTRDTDHCPYIPSAIRENGAERFKLYRCCRKMCTSRRMYCFHPASPRIFRHPWDMVYLYFCVGGTIKGEMRMK